MTDESTIQTGEGPEEPRRESDSRSSRLAAAAEAAYILQAVRA